MSGSKPYHAILPYMKTVIYRYLTFAQTLLHGGSHAVIVPLFPLGGYFSDRNALLTDTNDLSSHSRFQIRNGRQDFYSCKSGQPVLTVSSVLSNVPNNKKKDHSLV